MKGKIISGECNNCGDNHSEFDCLLTIAEELYQQLKAWKDLYGPHDPDSNNALRRLEDFKKII